MKEFKYTIVDEIGIHARPAGIIAKKAKEFADTVITITKNDKTVEIKKIMAVMGLGVQKGDTVTIKADGNSEDAAIEELEKLFKELL